MAAGGGPSVGGPAFNKFDMEEREQREEKMRKGRFRLGVLTLFRDDGVVTLFRSFQEKTTSHGLPHVHHARGRLGLLMVSF